ncbi:MAG TPA: hypothetical protein VN944_07400 [Nitrospiria bacterium]|nr:hypothetical protein [Nitrospiria bacterium]
MTRNDRRASKGLQEISHFFLSGGVPPGQEPLKPAEPASAPDSASKIRRAVAFLSFSPQTPGAFFTSNIGIGLARQGKSVFIVDAEKRQPNVESAFGLKPATLGLSDILYPSENKIFRDVESRLRLLDFRLELSSLPSHEKERDRRLVDLLNREESYSDLTLINLPRSSRLLQNPEWAGKAGEVVLIASPDRQILMETYAFIKTLFSIQQDIRIYVGISEAENFEQARAAFEKLAAGAKTLLEKKVYAIGLLLKDPAIAQSLQEQIPVMRGIHPSIQKGISAMTRVLIENEGKTSRFFALMEKVQEVK